MDSTRAYKFRVYPDAKRQSEINERLILAQQLYNKILEKVKSEYGTDKKSKVNKSTLNRYMRQALSENSNLLKLYSQTRQDIFIRLQKAFQNFFRRVKLKKAGKKIDVGFPRFKSRDRYASLTYPQDNGSFSIEKNRLRVSRIGTMKIELHRPVEGTIKTLTIKKEAGKYYAIFTAVQDLKAKGIPDSNPVGIDVGLKTFATLSNGTKIDKPDFDKKNEKHIWHWQRILARRKRGLKNRQKAKDRLNRKYQKSGNQTNDYLHKLTDTLVKSGYTSFAMEKLSIANMLQNHRLARSIQGSSWGRFKELLSYKAESAGLKVVLVDARNTSKTCSNCGSLKEMSMKDRVFDCDTCGYQNDRDVNASINILKRATVGQTVSHACRDMASAIHQVSQVASLKQEHTLRSEWNP